MNGAGYTVKKEQEEEEMGKRSPVVSL